MKRILLSLSVLVFAGALVAGGTVAFYSDTETSTGNIFVAGAINLLVDHTYASYNGEVCLGEFLGTGDELVENGGFETPDIPTGTWNVYPTGIAGWGVDSGAGIEIQDNVAGAPHSGGQFVELASNNPSSMSQVIDTVPGAKYKFSFYFSPRPGVALGDNTIGYKVEVTSNSGIIIDDTVGETATSGSGTVWEEVTYNFIALDTQTTLRFSDEGSNNNSLGGYIDDVSVVELFFEDGVYSDGNGTCELWSESDLVEGEETFWDFSDIKPGDYGVNVVSLHVYDNDAYVCLFPQHNLEDNENGLVEPELDLNDDSVTGELSGFLKLFIWNDLDGNGSYDPNTEEELISPNTLIENAIVQLEVVGNAPIDLIGIAWCVGEQSVAINGDITCDGSGNYNVAQTDEIVTMFSAYAEQTRNNDGFSCEEDVDLDQSQG